MSDQTQLISFTICGQNFRLRTETDDAERVKNVAAHVTQLIDQHRKRGAPSELRAAVMAAYELAYELDELSAAFDDARASGKTLDTAARRVDDLLRRLDTEMTPAIHGDESARPDSTAPEADRSP